MSQSSPIVRAVKKVLPAVISITMSRYLDFSESPSGIFGLGEPWGRPQRKKVKLGGGSGFIIDSSGIILTNRHVMEDPRAEYIVVLPSGEKLKPEILAKDPLNDVAILKIDASARSSTEAHSKSSAQGKSGLPIVELGDSAHLELGQEVVAIGNALGLFQNTVSTGVVSGLSREIKAQSDITQERTRLRGLIQTDAAINPGNSGGPLIDIEGKVIGINAAMVFGAENIGFALPINNAKKDLQDLKRYGRIRQPFLGVRYLPITEELKKEFNLPIDFGALVISEPDISRGIETAVVPGSPAARAGIREADIILEIGNKKITLEEPLEDTLQKFKIGQILFLKIFRHGRLKTLKLILGEKK